MKTFNVKIVLGTVALGLTSLSAQAQTPEIEATTEAPTPAVIRESSAADLRSLIEMMRADVRTEKAFIIAQNLPLTGDEAAEFWPLQREYEVELNKLLDERLEMILEFLPTADAMTEDEANALAKAAFDLEEKQTALKRATFEQFCSVIPAPKAVRFFQIENQINAMIDLQVTASLPLIQ